MPKVMVLVRDWELVEYIDLPDRRLRRIVRNELEDADFAAVVSIWVPTIDRAAVARWAGYEVHAYEVDEHPRWADRPPALSRASFICRIPSISSEEFRCRYAAHAALARRHHPVLCHYVQNDVLRPLTPDAPAFDGVSELGFKDSAAAAASLFDSPEGEAAIAADVAGFVDQPVRTKVHGVVL